MKMYVNAAFLVAIAILCAQAVIAQNITTILGGGNTTGEYVPAQIGTTQGGSVAIDAAGNVYIAEAYRVRKITTTGIIYTAAGTGVAGHSGDGGPATAAQLESVQGIAIDAAGNLYISEYYSHVIRKVNTSGIITTIAGVAYSGGWSPDGTPAVSANLNSPWGMAFDAAGNMYFAEFGNHMVRKISVSGILTTVAGGGSDGDGYPATSASLYYPRDVKINSAGELYIADASHYKVRKVNTLGIISTVAGTTFGFSGDGGPATAAQLGYGMNIALDAAGALYIGDYNHPTIRKVDASGIIYTICGSGFGWYSGDGGPASAAAMEGPYGIVFNSAGELCLTDYNRVRKINTAGIINTIAGNGFGLYNGDWGPAQKAKSDPMALLLDSVGNYFFFDRANYSIRKVNSGDTVVRIAGQETSGGSFGGVPAFTEHLPAVSYMVMNHAGTIYFSSANMVEQITPTGILAWVTGDATYGYAGDGGPSWSCYYRTPQGLALDSVENLYIADMGNHRLRKLDMVSGIVNTVIGNGLPGFSGDGGPAGAAQLNYPMSLVFDRKKNLYIGDWGNNRIRKVTRGGIISTFAGNGTVGYTGDGGPATTAKISFQSLATDDTGNIYFTDPVNNVIRKIDTFGTIVTVAGNGTTGFSGDGGPATNAAMANIYDLKVDHAGNIYVSDIDNHRIRYICANNAVTPAISITSTDDTICAGTSVTFTATYSGSGYLPQLQWIKNGVTIPGATSATYASSSLADGDAVRCVVTATVAERCATDDSAASNLITMTVYPVPTPPSVSSVVASPGFVSFPGETITYTATYSDGGSSPTFQWFQNGALIPGAITNPYSTNTVANGDIITFRIHTGNPCTTPDSASSEVVTAVDKTHVLHPAISIFPNPGNGVLQLAGNLPASHAHIEVSGITGNILYVEDIATPDGLVNKKLDLRAICPAGLYLLKVSTESFTGNYKFIVK